MAWGPKVSATEETSFTADTEVFFDQEVTLQPGETAHCQIVLDWPGSGVGDVEVRLYSTLDDSSEVWDDAAFGGFDVNGVVSAIREISFLVSGVYRFRVGVTCDTTSGLDDANFSYRLNGVFL